MSTGDAERGHEGHRSPDRDDRDPAERLRALIMAQAGAADEPEPPPGPVHWPTIPAADAGREWMELAGWVTGLRARFAALDAHVIPACWWRHNGHVEALAALLDHERESFSAMAPASAAVAWLRSLRDVAALLRAWTAELGCAGGHHDDPAPPPGPSGPEWEAHVVADVARRHEAEPGDAPW